MRINKLFLFGLGVIMTLLPASQVIANQTDTIYQGGDLLTLNADMPTVAAVGVRDGKLFAVGTEEEVAKALDKSAGIVDLDGKTLMPAFFDPHGHLLLTTLLVAYADLNPPPIGTVDSIAKLKQTLKDYAAEHDLKADDWIVGMNYDDTGMKEQRQPTRKDLDEVSKTNPIFIMHSSSHFGVANSKALELAGITAKTPDPKGGKYRHDSNGEPDGILVENPAFMTVMAKIKLPGLDVAIDYFIKTLLEQYAAQGMTTAQECGGAIPPFVNAMRVAGEKGKLPIDVIAYPNAENTSILENYKEVSKYKNRFRLAGMKIILDGSIQGYTAYLGSPYHVAPGSDVKGKSACDASHKDDLLFEDADGNTSKNDHSAKNAETKAGKGYQGKANYSQEKLDELVIKAISSGWDLAVHCNGDGAIDMLLKSMRKALAKYPVKDHRTTIIHAQTIRDDQLDAVKELGIGLSMFPGHIYYWGDRHVKLFLGPERTARMNPMQEALKRDIPLTIHNDTPVTPTSILDLVAFAVNRVSIAGKPLGTDQELSVEEALRTVTINAAWQHREEKRKGSLEPGKLADLIILSANPLKVDKTKIREIEVLETIKEGITVYQQKP